MLDGFVLPRQIPSISQSEPTTPLARWEPVLVGPEALLDSEPSPRHRERAMPGSVIVSAARTPIGKQAGGLAGFTAMDLGGFAIKAALERAGISGDDVDYVIMGQVLQAGQGQITARQAAVKAGIPMSVPAMTLNKVCLSGINALYTADQMIQAGDADVVVARGMESMTKAPYLLPGARAGYRMGNAELVDSMINDGLWCAFDAVHMGSGTEKYNAVAQISRQAQDELVGYGMVAGPDPSLLFQPANAIKKALSKVGKQVSDVSLFELNEAFAAVGIASMGDLGISDDVVNVNGGAIALGHPIGMSGARIVMTLINELRRRGGGLGAAALCGGGRPGRAR